MTNLTDAEKLEKSIFGSEDGCFLTAEEVERQRLSNPTIEQDGLTYRWVQNAFRGTNVERDKHGTITMTEQFEDQADIVLTKENSILGPVHNHYGADEDGYAPVLGIYQLEPSAQ